MIVRTWVSLLWGTSSLFAGFIEVELATQFIRGLDLGASTVAGMSTLYLLGCSLGVYFVASFLLGALWLKENRAYYQFSLEGTLCFMGAAVCWHVATLLMAFTLFLGIQAMAFHWTALLAAMPVFALLKAFASKGHEAMELARRWMARLANDVLKLDARRPVVFLRSFRSENELKPSEVPKIYREGLVGALLWTLLRPFNFEERLCRQLNRIGPVIAIGQPTDALPRLGAARTYIRTSVGNDVAWQQRVTSWLEGCRAVCMLAGSTQGLHWEFDQVIKTIPPRRIVLIIPPLGDALEGTRLFFQRAKVPFDPRMSEFLPPAESGELAFAGQVIPMRRQPIAVGFSEVWQPTVIFGDYDEITYNRILDLLEDRRKGAEHDS